MRSLPSSASRPTTTTPADTAALLKTGHGATTAHDYKRNGTTMLFAALDVLTGEVFGRNMWRHRHQEFIRFLNALERDNPAG